MWDKELLYMLSKMSEEDRIAHLKKIYASQDESMGLTKKKVEMKQYPKIYPPKLVEVLKAKEKK